jgi:hypothetical protein
VASIGDARNETIVFVKDAADALVRKAKDRGNMIVYDPLDMYCYLNRSVSFDSRLVDVVIVPSIQAAAFYRSHGFESAEYAVIPHQWDPRIEGRAAQDYCRPGYIGHDFNCPAWWDGEAHQDMTDTVIAAAPRYNLHLSLNARLETHILLKPATKVATASAVLANVVAYPDPAVVELLGTDYPYLVQDDPQEAVRAAKGSFGSTEWKRARDRMSMVRDRTSIEAVAALYARLEEKQQAEAACRSAPMLS